MMKKKIEGRDDRLFLTGYMPRIARYDSCDPTVSAMAYIATGAAHADKYSWFHFLSHFSWREGIVGEKPFS